MKKTRTFWDVETDERLSIEYLRGEYRKMKADGDTEAATFEEYLKNCLSKNGTLIEIL